MSYNISLNFSSILAKLPGSRFLTILRKGGYESPVDTLHPVASAVEELQSSLDVDTAVTAAMDKLTSTPGAWAFFASGYMLGLLLVTILLHRMRNVIIPSRIPIRRTFHSPPAFLSLTYISRRLWSSILPLNLSRSTTRLAWHLPSIYFLCKMLLIWCLLILQTSQLSPSFSDAQKRACWGILGYVEKLFVWNSKKEMRDICWATFCSVCAALLVEGIMKALNGIGSALPIGNVNSNTSSFNLVGYAFLLHAYSFPAAHSRKSTNENPSRPDKHAIITIAIPLLQLTIFHILSVSRRYSRHRLIPTALTSFLSLAHFHGTLFAHFFSSSPAPAAPTPTNPLSRLKSTPYLEGSKFTYPLLNYVPNIFETFLMGTILLTVSLNALVQLLVRGRVVHIFSGLGVGSGVNWQDGDATSSGFFEQLPYEEDFASLLLRVGTASLEATGLRGWNNEVAPIPLPVKPRNRNRARGDPHYGVVRMGRIDVTKVQYGSSAHATASTSRLESSSNPSNPYEDLSILRRRRTKSSGTQQRQQRGLFNEVRTIDLGVVTKTAEPSCAISGWWRQIKQSWPFFIALWDILTGLVFLLWDKARPRGRSYPSNRAGNPSTVIRTSAEGHRREEDDQSVEDDDDSEEEIYSRFLRGEEISDDDDVTSSFEDDDSCRGFEDDGDDYDEQEEEEENAQGEAVRLFSDFLQNGLGAPTTSAGGGEMVLAHLLHREATSSGPLTRQGWRGLVGQGDASDYRSHFRDYKDDDNDIRDLPYNRNDATPADSQPIFNTAECIICMNGQRDIICWPCRCLVMCDNCREAMASRSAPIRHSCPCCRRTVEGYSRIYIP